jgi:hypothetical protein
LLCTIGLDQKFQGIFSYPELFLEFEIFSFGARWIHWQDLLEIKFQLFERFECDPRELSQWPADRADHKQPLFFDQLKMRALKLGVPKLNLRVLLECGPGFWDVGLSLRRDQGCGLGGRTHWGRRGRIENLRPLSFPAAANEIGQEPE